MARIKHGIIGTGGMARGHAGAFNKVRGVEVFGCYDVAPGRAEAFARDHGVRHAMDSLDDLLDACDAVSIVTPDAFHAELSLKALGAGKHVLCEKPLTTTLADARKVARAAETAAQKHGVVHMVNFSYRNSSQFQQALRIAGSGRLGAIRHVTGRYFQAWLASTVWGNPATHEAWLWRQQVPA
ncbi:MAG: Gfo/Idh/MocA family oxidoreductase, partial [Planctomycetota bacterium]